MAILPGVPDNVRTDEEGDFCVAIHCRRTTYAYLPAQYPKFRKLVLKLPISAKIHYLVQIGGRVHALVVKYSTEGKILRILEDRQGKVVKAVSDVGEKDEKLSMGSILTPFVAVYEFDWGNEIMTFISLVFIQSVADEMSRASDVILGLSPLFSHFLIEPFRRIMSRIS